MQDEKPEELEKRVDWPEVSEEVKQVFTENTGEYDPNVMKVPDSTSRMPAYLRKYALTGIFAQKNQDSQ